MKFRIINNKKGWIIEYLETKYFGFKKIWKPVTKYHVTERPLYYKDSDSAIDGALTEIKNEIIFSYLFK